MALVGVFLALSWLLCCLAAGSAFTVPTLVRRPRANHVTSSLVTRGSVFSDADMADTGTDVVSNIAAQKKKLLKAVGGKDKQSILSTARELESHHHIVAPVSGRWSLVFSTMSEDTANPLEGALDNLADGSLPRRASDALYKTLFRYLPALAGGQERSDADRGPPWKVANEQLVDTRAGTVDNTVDLRLSDATAPLAVRIRVRGTAEPVVADDETLLNIVFTQFSVGPAPGARFPPTVTLPLPRPVGSLRTTFCDDDLRLSRGGRGGIFVLKRLRRSFAE